MTGGGETQVSAKAGRLIQTLGPVDDERKGWRDGRRKPGITRDSEDFETDRDM